MAATTLEAKEIAKKFMKPYVERGVVDTFLRDMGTASNGIWVVIGGYCNGQKVTNEQVAVDLHGSVSIFRKKDLIAELKQPQMKLL